MSKVSDISEIAYGSYNGCEKCGSSELIFGIGWDCVCDLLIENGNCKNCMCYTEYCKCPKESVEIIENQTHESKQE